MTFLLNTDYANIEEVSNAYPNAEDIIVVDGGWMVFFDATERDTWINQQ